MDGELNVIDVPIANSIGHFWNRALSSGQLLHDVEYRDGRNNFTVLIRRLAAQISFAASVADASVADRYSASVSSGPSGPSKNAR